MYRVIKSYLSFFVIFVFAIQNVEAVSFKTSYKIISNNQQLGTLRRTINSEGHVSINLNLMPLSGAEVPDNGIGFMQTVISGQIPSLNSVFHHLQSLHSGLSPASASPAPSHEISMTLTEPTGQPSSITYNILGQTCHYSASGQCDDAGIFIGGQQEVYSSNPDDGVHVQALSQLTPYSETDEGVGQTTTIQEAHIGDIGSLTVASLSDAHGEEVTGSYFLFGQHFEQLLTTLVEGQNNNSGLLYLQSIFPIFEVLPDQDTYEILALGYGQELTYDPVSNMITQQDPPNDPSPYEVITTYQLNSDGFITSIVVNEGGNTVVFSSEETTQTSEETGALSSLDTSAPAFELDADSLPFPSQFTSAFIILLSYCQMNDSKNK